MKDSEGDDMNEPVISGKPDTPIVETLLALDNFQRQGKILYPAVSN
jgi:aryl-alcohol dehydrogenase-like predicted oxidoreductase